jgi:hypothetical protein
MVSWCRFRFLYYPEYITVGSPVVLREGRTRGIGKIVKRYTKENYVRVCNANGTDTTSYK